MPHQGAQPIDLTGQPVMGADYSKNPPELHVLSTDPTGALVVSVSAIVADKVNQGTQGTVPESWFVELTDGTNVVGTDANPIRVDPTGTTVQPVDTPVSSTSSAPAAQTVTSTSASILAANANRLECTIVNTGIVPIFIGLGKVPTATAYHIALSPCSVANDGTGGVYVSDIWKGAVNAIVASTSGTVCVAELT
jgi:hypothetical protein